mgnify:CR=1 FL=1
MGHYYPKLNAANAYIWRIVHRNNLPWILENGLHCRNSPTLSPDYVNIGNEELIDKRSRRVVDLPPGGTLSDYVSFYFTPFSPMMYNIHTGRSVPKRRNEEIIILVSTLHKVKESGRPYLFTDRHAYPPYAIYYNDIEHLTDKKIQAKPRRSTAIRSLSGGGTGLSISSPRCLTWHCMLYR